ncbi:putative lysosomal Pro-Xaa carboxypeptidase [Rosa chinensis]|uniref:Putative lysosomal Pro-Xaa carboxypeptidase n=1 Tax=Rosa chinensis TaxID=74649 RepID=A0A2P6QGL5_ROSCH|nr:lysosomal Pro-X carboxypeptidase [Rosa chinensis]PRQ33317.1 putative lysosomal Pro-Xaa carboxypeptidase [Rosa chinensis]
MEIKRLTFSHQSSLLLISLIFVTTSVSLKIPRLSPTGGQFIDGNYWTQSRPSEASSPAFDPKDFQAFYYNQTLDHFNFRYDSFNTFQQRYLINSKHWGGSNISAPILAYLGAEESIDVDIPIIGFLPENAIHFQALQIYIEHRYYGESIPFGSREVAFKNASTLGYFNSAQAIADYAEILIHVKKQLHAEHSPVIVIGGSYGGMLASWFRLKYPHVTLGALASSAPILYFDDIVPPETGYYSIVTKDFQEASETCYQIIKKSWSEIDNIASKREGLSSLSKKFRTCRPLTKSSELKNYLKSMYARAAQYDRPPKYPVTVVCGGIDGASSTDDILTKIFAGVVAYTGNRSCYVNQPRNLTETDVGWRWQTCSDLVIPISVNNDTMFPPYKFDVDEYINKCKATYGVPPRPNWVTTYFGGHDIKLSLSRFASNIIFSNGLRDPYSIGGVLEDISDSVVAVHAKNGSHCLDILTSNQTTDPDWLVNQRKSEVKIIKGWIAKYYADLQALQ